MIEMKNALMGTLLLACLSWMPLAVAADVDEAEAFLGKWKVEMDMRGRIIESKLVILRNEEGELAGTWESRRGKNDLENVKVADGVLSFMRKFERQGMEMEIDSTSKIVDGKLVGTMSTQMGDLPFTGKRPEVEEAVQTQAPQTAADMLKRMDTNGDGKIQESEAPERLQQFFGMLDSNADGELDEAEIEVMMEYRRQQQGN